jgi:uncharacterized protein
MATAAMAEQVSVSSSGVTLAGTWRAGVAGQAPVVILPGSGPTDRDGNNPMGVTAAPYRLLAEALADAGIGSLRIDKRGMFGSAAPTLDPNAVTIAEQVADVQAWVELARTKSGAPCAWVAGHSEGGLIALSMPDRPSLCGRILIAAPGRALGVVLREQMTRTGLLTAEVEAAIVMLEAGGRVDPTTLPTAIAGLFNPAAQGYLAGLLAIDPAGLAAATTGPLLVLQGDNDLQVTLSDARSLAAARPDAKLVILPRMNHVLKVADTDEAANIATYADPTLPIAPDLVATIMATVRP